MSVKTHLLPSQQSLFTGRNSFVKFAATVAFVTLNLALGNSAFAQTTFEDAMNAKLNALAAVPDKQVKAQMLYPNDAPSGIMAPSGFGGSGTYLFGGIGSTYPELYKNDKADLIAFGGVSVGNPVKAVNVAAGLNMADVHRFQDFSANFTVSRQLSAASSITAGGLALFASKLQSDAPGATFYLAFSHAVQWAPSKTPGCSALSYTVGFGNGRFLHKSPYDVLNGKGKDATGVFGSVTYEIVRHVNVAAEWYGTNLGVSTGIRPFRNPLSIGFGVDNLTSYSGDKASMILTLGYPLTLRRAPAN